jgi:hypothetical protein
VSDTGAAAARAEAVLALGGLDDPGALASLLAAARDLSVLPARFKPESQVDPFDAFFGGTAEVPEVTLSDLAIGRLGELAVPPSAVDALVAAVSEGAPEALVAAVARLTGTIAWEDPPEALRRLVPALHAADAPLYELIVRQDEVGLAILIASALAPYRSRAVNELLNHGLAHHKMAAALCDAVVSGRVVPNSTQAMAILGQLVAWNVPRAAEVAASLEERFPWAVAYGAFDDVDARARLGAWIESGAPYPDIFPSRLGEAFRARPAVAGYPLEAWLRRCDGDCGPIVAWGAVASCESLLRSWAAQQDERGRISARLLVGAGLSAGLEPLLPSLIVDGGWDAAALRSVASVPGVAAAIAAVLGERPNEWAALVPAWVAADPSLEERRALAGRLLSIAEAAPVVRRPMRRGGVHVQRDGVDVPSLRELVASCASPDLAARFEAVAPYAGPA